MIAQGKEDCLSPVDRLTLSISRKHGTLRARNAGLKYRASCEWDAWNVGISYQSAHTMLAAEPCWLKVASRQSVLYVISRQRRPRFRVPGHSAALPQAYTSSFERLSAAAYGTLNTFPQHSTHPSP
jgi:hypothetical protein